MEHGWDIFDTAYAGLYWNKYTGKFSDFIKEWRGEVEEVVDKYQPDVLWFNGGDFTRAGVEDTVKSVLAYYLNKGEEQGKHFLVLNKLPTSDKWNFPQAFGMLTFEEGRDRSANEDKPWVDDMKLSSSR